MAYMRTRTACPRASHTAVHRDKTNVDQETELVKPLLGLPLIPLQQQQEQQQEQQQQTWTNIFRNESV